MDWREEPIGRQHDRRGFDCGAPALRASSQRGRPFGALPWRDATVRRFALASTLRPRGQPNKTDEKGT